MKSFFSQISDGRGEEVVFGESIRFFHMFHREIEEVLEKREGERDGC